MTIEDLTPAEREQVQEIWLRQYLARMCPAGIRRATDPKPTPDLPPATLAARRDQVRRLQQTGATRSAMADQMGVSVMTIARDVAWLRAQRRLP